MSWLSNLARNVASALRPLERPVGAAVISIAAPTVIATVEADLHKVLVERGLQATEPELDAILEKAVNAAIVKTGGQGND